MQVQQLSYISICIHLSLILEILQQDSTRPVADIAERIGYGSASAFSLAFTRYTGISPGKYARQRAARNVSRPALT